MTGHSASLVSALSRALGDVRSGRLEEAAPVLRSCLDALAMCRPADDTALAACRLLSEPVADPRLEVDVAQCLVRLLSDLGHADHAAASAVRRLIPALEATGRNAEALCVLERHRAFFGSAESLFKIVKADLLAGMEEWSEARATIAAVLADDPDPDLRSHLDEILAHFPPDVS